MPITRRAPSTSRAAEGLADEDGRRHREAEDEGGHQEHDDVGVGRGGERVLAEEAPDPDGVDRAVQRLQDRGAERRKSEGEQGRPDRAGGQVALAGAGGGLSCVGQSYPSLRHSGEKPELHEHTPASRFRAAVFLGPGSSPG